MNRSTKALVLGERNAASLTSFRFDVRISSNDAVNFVSRSCITTLAARPVSFEYTRKAFACSFTQASLG